MNYERICFRCKIEQPHDLHSFSAKHQIGKWSGYRLCDECSDVVIKTAQKEVAE